MNFEPTHEQILLGDSVRDLCSSLSSAKRSPEAMRANWTVFAELGWLMAGVPEEMGGLGGGAGDQAVIARELGAALATEPFLACGVLSTQVLAALVAQSGAVAPLLGAAMAGERIVALAGDMSLQQRWIAARREAGGFVLSGSIPFVPDDAIADMFLVPAKLDTDGSALIFAVPRGHESLAMKRFALLDGSYASELSFAAVRVDGQALLAQGDGAGQAISCGIARAAVMAACEMTGGAEAALWQTRDYLKTRRQFGAELASFQALQHRMADMYIAIQLAQSMLAYGIAALANPGSSESAAAQSACLIQAAKRARFVTAQAIQLHGGIGVTEELPVGGYFRRISTLLAQFGSIDSHVARLGELIEADDGLVL